MMDRIFSIKDPSRFEFAFNLAIGSAQIRMHFASRESQVLFTRPFAHLAEPSIPKAAVRLDIYVLHDRPGGEPLEAWNRFERESSHEKQRQLYQSKGQHLLYQHESKVLAGYDSHAQKAYYYIPSLDMLPFYEKAAPMRMIFHHLAEENGWSLVHGAAVGLDGKGILLVGAGGSGKTTTALSAAMSGFEYLGDDYVILNPKDGSILSLYQSGKFRWDAGKILTGIEKLAVNTHADRKGIFFLNEGIARVSKKLPFCGVVIPRIGGGRVSSYRPLPAAKALLVLSSSTIFQMPGSGKSTLQSISKAIRNVPAYEMVLGTCPEEINSKLAELIKGM